jgi:hypothetical protein
MYAQPSLLSVVAWFGVLIVCLVVALLILRFVAKLKWLTAICAAVLLVSILSLPVLRGLRGKLSLGVIFLIPAVLCAGILLAKFFVWLFKESSSQISVNPAERSRILRMVEDGKISANEGRELLDAMGKSSALRGEEKFSRIDILMLVGVALVVLGFFLPWAYIRMAPVPGPFGRVSGYQAGYHTGALGWAIFIIGIASAVPVFVTPRNLLYKISMLQIFLTFIGSILVISVMVRAEEHLGAGLIFCLIGFIVGSFASVAKLKKLAA